ncbi:hypothetical protein [Streptomyces canus]|uniref:hypothetical protein n=1 Tax=Streptomyces canus TaxID=58343 RepID=UPI002786DA6C|nr:hypothetical protein [Streptomyces canus]MDQ0760550.1 hypothetical protein [Streptomyces canus]MDQ1070823.1 hypothetical protein [Streptomyces canus]
MNAHTTTERGPVSGPTSRRLTPLGTIVPSESARTEATRVLDVPERRPAKPITFDSAL